MAPIQETHSGVAGVTPHGQPRTLHGAADDGLRVTARTTPATPPGHARHPNVVHGVRTGDLVRVLGKKRLDSRTRPGRSWTKAGDGEERGTHRDHVTPDPNPATRTTKRVRRIKLRHYTSGSR